MNIKDIFSRFFKPSKPGVMIVDDDPAVLQLVKDVLEVQGYEVTLASDAVQALARLKQGKFGLLIIDGRMPNIDGIELLDTIRALPGGKEQKVILMSAENMLGPINRAYELGIVDWIPKPFTVKTLLTKVSAHLKK